MDDESWSFWISIMLIIIAATIVICIIANALHNNMRACEVGQLTYKTEQRWGGKSYYTAHLLYDKKGECRI